MDHGNIRSLKPENRKTHDATLLAADKEKNPTIKEIKKSAGRRFIREFALALGTQNPFLILPEIKDELHERVRRYLETAVRLVEQSAFEGAARCFNWLSRNFNSSSGKTI
ncbi:MAG: hypothetical protein QW590_00360 [Candidatus Bilamarchaeaceae archaeon]